jgi:hypothetical protein
LKWLLAYVEVEEEAHLMRGLEQVVKGPARSWWWDYE